MKKLLKPCLLLFALTLCTAAIAQEQAIRSVHDLKNQELHEFNAPLLLNGYELPLRWEERITSFSSGDGTRTFVAYDGEKLAGILSVNAAEAFGELSAKGKTYTIGTDGTGNLTATEQSGNCHCAACGNAAGENEEHRLPSLARNISSRFTSTGAGNGIIHNNDVLRRYRLALLIDYWTYPGNKPAAEAFMASVEAFLNEIYYRDFGICFEVVKNDNLIRDTPEKAVFLETTSGYDILSASKGEFDKIIPDEEYDLGFVIHPMRYEAGVGVGYAYMNNAYSKHGRTQGVAINSTRTVAHELGHMFGAEHTFIETGSYQTELGNGQSLMGTEKAFPRNFFSLVTLQDIRNDMARNNYYYTNAERTRVVTPDGTEIDAEELDYNGMTTNIVNGVRTYNNAPVIDTTRLQRTYIVPPGAYLQFRIHATDADGDELTYTAQQADVRNESAARFRTIQGSGDSCVMLRKDYYEGNEIEFSGNTTEAGKAYTFWLAASDPKSYSAGAFENDPHATAYDVYETKVEVKGSSRFAVNHLSPNIVNACHEGYKVKMNWNADPEVFDENSRFRVLFSKDGGATYDCVLKEEIRALDNTCDIYIPYGIGTDYYAYRNGKRVYKCLLKLEDANGPAFTEFPTTTTTTGFYISRIGVTFEGLPAERYVVATKDNLPPVPTVTAKNNGGAAVSFTETESQDGKFIFRIWETTYSGKTYGFEQIIKIIGSEETTGIDEVKSENGNVKSENGEVKTIYDLQGRKIEKITEAGIYIVDGVKRVVK